MQEIRYKSKKLKTECTDFSVTRKVHGDRRAELIHLRLQQLEAANSVEELLAFGIGRCHPLHGNRKGTYAMDLDHPFRLVFEKVKDEIRVVKILEIEDYH